MDAGDRAMDVKWDVTLPGSSVRDCERPIVEQAVLR